MSTTEVEIRAASPRDAEAIYEVHKQSVTGLRGTAYSASQVAVWAEARTAADYERSIEKAFVLVAEGCRGVVGFAVLGCRSGELHALYVHPEWTGRGIGKRLLTAMESSALERGLSVVTLNATPNAVAFYAAQGYLSSGPNTYRLSPGVELVCERMQKQLDRSGGSMADKG